MRRRRWYQLFSLLPLACRRFHSERGHLGQQLICTWMHPSYDSLDLPILLSSLIDGCQAEAQVSATTESAQHGQVWTLLRAFPHPDTPSISAFLCNAPRHSKLSQISVASSRTACRRDTSEVRRNWIKCATVLLTPSSKSLSEVDLNVDVAQRDFKFSVLNCALLQEF